MFMPQPCLRTLMQTLLLANHVYYLSYFISDNNYQYLLLYCALSLNINSYITQRKSSLQINFINQ